MLHFPCTFTPTRSYIQPMIFFCTRGKCMSNSIFRAAKLSSSHWLHHYHDLLSCRHPSAGLNKPLHKPAYFCLPEPSHSGKPGEKWLNSCLGSLDTTFLHTAESMDGVRKRGKAGWEGGRSRAASAPPGAKKHLVLHHSFTLQSHPSFAAC